MVRRKICSKLSVWGCVLVIVALTLGCSSKRERGPEFLDSESELDPDAEAERLGCRSTESEEIFPDWKARMKEQSWLFLGRRVCLSGLHDRQEHA